MAEKGFGVKDINLIGPSGTPTITSPNNLNLNAVNVAISTNVSIGGTLSVTGNVSVGGTLTYEDVTNIDSVGIVTARAGVVVGDTSNTTFRVHRIQGASATNCGLALNSGGSLNLFTDSSGAGTSRISISNTGNIQFGTIGSIQFLLEDYVTHAGDTNTQYGFDGADSYVVKTGGSTRLAVNNSGANVVGALTVNGSAISIDPTDSDIQVAYTVTANGSSAYRFAGNGVVSTADNPDLYLTRGKKYRFINNSGGSHPFQIRVSSGGSAYSTGVTNNGASSGNIDFAPTFDSPALLVYQCTVHGGMVGNIYISDGKYDTKANQPAFRAGRSTDVNPGNNGTIVFNYVANPTHFNQGGYYDNSTGAFTAPVAGIYNFYTQVLWENVSSGQNMADCIMLYYNASGGASGGTLVSYDARRAEYIVNETGNAGYYGAHTTLLLYMAANSSIYVRNARNLTVHGNANFTFFQGYLVG